MEVAARTQPRTCYAHPDVPHTGRCDGCERPICETCAFPTAAGRLCPDCVGDGASAGQRRASATQSIVALVCAAGVVLCLTVLFNAVGDASTRGTVSMAGMALVLVGMTTALLGRDHGRRTGSPLSLIAVIANSVLFGIFVLLIAIGLFRRH